MACMPGAGEAPAPTVDLNRERLAACPTAKAVLMTASDGGQPEPPLNCTWLTPASLTSSPACASTAQRRAPAAAPPTPTALAPRRARAGVGGFNCCGTAVDAVAETLSCASDKVLLLSIGGCGDVDRMAILPAINHLAATLDGGAEGAYHAACVLTATDTTCKSASLEVGRLVGAYLDCGSWLGARSVAESSGCECKCTHVQLGQAPATVRQV